MAIRINVKGVIVPNDYAWFYDWLEMDYTAPKNIEAALKDAAGQPVEVYINSPGGVIFAGSEIYTLIRQYQGEVKIYVVGEASSAASIIAMAGYCEMSPTSLMMVHCVSSVAKGNHNDLEKTAEVLRTADEALSTAYMAKSKMSREDVLAMMEAETWLTASQAKEKGLIDAIMFDRAEEPMALVASSFRLPSQAQLEKVKALMREQSTEQEAGPNDPVSSVARARLRLLQLKTEGVNVDE